MEFPIYSTKTPGDDTKYDLNSPAGRHKYFQSKAKTEIEEIKEYLESNTFVGFLLAKKSAGKGTYSKMFQEIFGEDRVALISVGDLVRDTHALVTESPEEEKQLRKYLESNYRGYISIDEAMDAFVGKSQDKLIPTEFILALIKRKIESLPEKAVFMDGFPRNLDQVSYSLYFRQIMDLRDDPDFFVLIDIPESVIDERIKARVVCPLCHTSRNVKLLPTQYPTYNKDEDKIVLLCDNPACEGHQKQAMVEKEGDSLGIEPIRDRLENDGQLIEKALSLHGIPKVLLRNSIPVEKIDLFSEFEITPEYSYDVDDATSKVSIKESPWVIKDDAGGDCHSLLAAPVVVSMIKQIHQILLG